MKRETILVAIASAAIFGMACGSGSPAAPSPQPTPAPPSPALPPPAPAPLTEQEFKNRLEALILGTGPMSDQANPGCIPGRFIRWKETLRTMRVVTSSKTDIYMRSTLRGVFEAYTQILGGSPSLEEEIVDALPPLPTLVAAPQIGVISVDVADDLTRACGGPNFSGCAFPGGLDSTYSMGTIWLRTGVLNSTSAHEAGHMIGFCHIVGARSVETIMGGASGPTSLDLEILEKVIHSGLRPGATKADFVAKGLL